MGFLDKLRGGSDNAITLDVRPAEVAPGDEVAVRFEVTGQLDAKARGVRVAFEATASYKAKVTRTYGPSEDENVSTVEEWQSYQLHHEERELPAQAGPGELTFKGAGGRAPELGRRRHLDGLRPHRPGAGDGQGRPPGRRRAARRRRPAGGTGAAAARGRAHPRRAAGRGAGR
ncbi:hypothetical protein ACTWP6_29865 [Mycobacterium sp. 4D054]|uniref:hypothetical protein n=1 Tax=unclassified Mycobacterium TaxID=2642494 RepID=UPI0021B268FB|nr:hypothetical protein [Mycobacterium sp. SMC-8]UXA11074.1 hypothetical protein KXD97_23905 [Mycobacterium sp. SMC-8]